MKTANIPVYGNITVYIKYCVVCLKTDDILRCLEYIFISIFIIKKTMAIAALVPLSLLIVKTLTNVQNVP